MSVMEAVPLIKAPDSWPLPVVAGVAMLVLAGLDMLGAVAAKEWAEHRSVVPLLLGVATFVVLWWVYASSLLYAELALVTMGWIVLLQVGLLVVDRLRYDVHLSAGKWVAVVVIVAAQAYLLLGPAASSADSA